MNHNTILYEILKYKQEWINIYKVKKPLSSFYNKIKKSKKNFKKTIKSVKPAFILECKKSSPSYGILNKNFNIQEIIKIYNKYATAISVITEEKFFHGNFRYLKEANKNTKKPLLCKDFFIDPYQIYYARYCHADAILLMMSILNNSQYILLSNIAKKIGLDIITEVHNKKELERAILLNAEIIGINNRNLHTLLIDLNNTYNLAPLIPKEKIIICESGINNYNDIRKFSNYVNGFLIGTHFMKSKNLQKTICSTIYGNNKICGLTSIHDASISEKNGCIYGGLIFCPSSPRYINIKNSEKITKNIQLRYVGVFCNATLEYIISRVIFLSLSIVQLHGQEDQNFIKKLRFLLPKNVKIWKALSVDTFFPTKRYKYINRYLLDYKKGGTGQTFNWNLLLKHDTSKMILAGGLNPNNTFKASQLGFYGLDFNSGIEHSPGIKDKKKIISIFNILKNFS